MARRVYFPFHYQRDIWRANVVRNSWVTHPDREIAGFYDHSLWETAKTQGDEAIKRLINAGLEGSSVTCVLIGHETWTRRWVKYEIQRSWERGNGLLGVYIHNIEDRWGNTDLPGRNPFDAFTVGTGFNRRPMSDFVHLYDWTVGGYENLGAWVETAARLAAMRRTA